MPANAGTDGTTEGLTPFQCVSVLTVTDRHNGVCSGSGDSTEQSDSDDNLEANTFGIDGDLLEATKDGDAQLDELLEQIETDTKDEQLADHYAELAARQLESPGGELWP